LKQYDCILKAGGKPVKSLADLMQAVDEAKENELPLDVIRGGKAMTVKVMPAKRPEPQDVVRRPPQLPAEELRRWMENFNRGEPNQFRYRIFGPGAVLPGEKGLPKGLSVSITRSGDEPAKITVKKDDQSWEVTEKELDKLPDDVRPHVERMLGRGGAAVMALPGLPSAPGAVPAPIRPDIRRPDGQSERQLKEMMDQVDRLRRQMEELQKNLPRDGKPGETRT
jgi:hypothetical protein